MHYYQHHIGDFIKDTSYLTNEEVGIYLKLLWIYYDTEQPLPNDLFVLSMKVNARDNEPAVKGILEMFFELSASDVWIHHRCNREIEQYQALLNNASKAGRASAEKRALAKQTFNDRSTDVQLTMNHEPGTNNQEPLKAKSAKRASQLPKEFAPNDGHKDLAKELGVALAPEFKKFVDYCVANGKTYKDWDAGLRTWIRNSATYSRSRPQRQSMPTSFDHIDYGKSGKL